MAKPTKAKGRSARTTPKAGPGRSGGEGRVRTGPGADTGTAGGATPGGSSGGTAPRPAGSRPRPAPTKRTTPPASGRYTPPVPRSEKVSPIWVPIVMFSCLGLGMAMIILNYVNLLPGPDPSNTYLMIGLGLITVGFITATRYH
jgi:hypothetical protein